MDRRNLLKGAAMGGVLWHLRDIASAAAAVPKGEIMSLGWYVIFSRPSMIDEMTAFYGQALGLPLMLHMRGPVQNRNYFWAGEDIVIDLAHHALEEPLSPREADPATARQIAFFRTDDLSAWLATLEARGVKILAPRATAHGREAFILDPMGRLIGFRERNPNSGFAADREARRRRLRGEAFNPGCAPMPAHLQELGWVRITVADQDAAKRFYGDRLGLRFIGRDGAILLFDLGDNTTLEIASGGVPRATPAEQRASETVMILRVVDFPAMAARLRAAGQAFPFKIYDMVNGGFSYVADTEGNLVGLADRKPPGTYREKLPAAPEDLEATRRWIEAAAAKR